MTIIEAVARAMTRKRYEDVGNDKPGVAIDNIVDRRWILDADDSRAAVLAVLNHLKDNVTPEMVGAGWGELKRKHLPKLGPGPGVVECFRAMIEQAIKEIG